MPRFYLPENLSVGQTVDLPDNIVRHLNVLR
ncbi:16S rRNA (uracil(1498)-N(3))-methyltransferase, partial [Neisseria gonorrhoeae]